ncbi:MAG: VOC family protein [Candidatus Eremiobacteraeota bacterium]|nr:VOC family protein [Candidatus Eremiobacteraeota bacterium]
MATQLVPYVFFYGRCEEALEFYKGVFGGGYEMMRVKDTPMASEMPPQSANSVMHASFTADDLRFMASDGASVKPVDPDAGNVSLALSFDDAARGERVFQGLSAGGKVQQPIGGAFWGGRFGMVTDKFGSEWMITLP